MKYKTSGHGLVSWSELRGYLPGILEMLNQLLKVFQSCALIMDPAIGCITKSKGGR